VCVLLYISCIVILLILDINNTPTPFLFYFTPCPLQHLSFHIHGTAILSDTTIHSYDPNRPIPHTVTDQESFNPDGTESILRNATVKLQGGRTGEIESSCTSLSVNGCYRLPLDPYPYHSFFPLSLSFFLSLSPSLSLCFYLSHFHTHALSFPLSPFHSPSHFASSSGVCSCG
jgi:hypothetical protein